MRVSSDTSVAGLSRHVAAAVRSRGTQYYFQRRVKITSATAEAIEATVAGTARYSVRLELDGEVLVVSCTCPYLEDRGEPCKHVWATILAAGGRRLLAPPGQRLPRSIEVAGGDDLDDSDDSDDFDDLDDPGSDLDAGRRPPPRARPSLVRRPAKPDWRRLVESAHETPGPNLGGPPPEDLLYVVDAPASRASGGLTLELLERRRKATGGWGKPRPALVHVVQIPVLPEAADREILALLVGAKPALYGSGWYERLPAHCRIPEPLAPALMPRLCATGRCHLRAGADGLAPSPLAWDDGEPWRLWLEVRREGAERSYRVTGSLRRDAERMALAEPALLLSCGLLFTAGRAARLDHGGAFGWISLLRRDGALEVPLTDGGALLERLLARAAAPALDLPEELRYEEVGGAPRPRLRLVWPQGQAGWVHAHLSFLYGDREVAAQAGARSLLFSPGERRLTRRDLAAERRAGERLRELGLRPAPESSPEAPVERLPAGAAPALVRTLLGEGWLVEAQGKPYRAPGPIEVRVASGIDWFELQGGVEFGGETARFPQLLAALARGDGFVPLEDGSLGLLPEEWLRRFAGLAGCGRAAGGHLRFEPAQVSVLDALLAAEPAATCDEDFARVRERLARCADVVPAEAPPGFAGELRDYQRAGLGWLHSLRELGFGGCLADDMGLGKTVQVLALLESRRQEGAEGKGGRGPSLVVAPRSVAFNWLAEAARFAPGLRVLGHSGAARRRDAAALDGSEGHDLVVTTYGTVRRDLEILRAIEFDYVVLDEAQAIKNRDSQSAKAARLLKGRHRLALTGTPIENHLGELGSLLEFLNPGLLGASALLRARSSPDEEMRGRLARALRPFILRRTKGQVAAELPAKVEQTLYCELPARQRRLYDELRDHYRGALAARIDDRGLGRAKILVLEALLRLRQAACHTALLERDAADEPSAKLDVLLPQLREVLEEGHKALVFSQFTSFLALLRQRLDREGIAYEYLDGHTRDREERVERFQSDPGCGLFLISLKAGGLGLNLTAADYVYLLDPWWNPAVEAQAIDRAHRIGQTRRVFAYRLVAR
ncbi:MAG TPA: DEAD/DEAH box helicase, partial [Thermoanaerobaculia bacterium]